MLTVDEKTATISALREQERRMSKWVQQARQSSYYNAEMIAEDKEQILNHTRSALRKVQEMPAR